MAETRSRPQGCGLADVLEKQQERQSVGKYGDLVPKLPKLLAKKQSKKCFDSADWSMSRQKLSEERATKEPGEMTLADMLELSEGSSDLLPAKLTPTLMPPRRLSNLGDR